MKTDAVIACPACGAKNATAANFCNQCSKPLAATQAATPAGAERKQVTVLFADLTGFTALTERLDPEETRQIMGRIFRDAAEIVARYEGRIEKFVGDAIMAIFGVPIAHEDDPQRAVRAALEVHAAVAKLSPEIQARTGVAIALHSGVNTGVVVTGELQFDHGTAGPLGDTINTASRLMNAAPSGEIWVGPETRRLIEQNFELEDLGAHDFKGKAQALAVARVCGVRARETGAQTRQFRGAFVGRQAELGMLLGAAEKMRDGQAQVLSICGDAGTGKTRLVNEFRAQVGADVQWLEGRAYPYARDIPYAPLMDLLNRVWRIEETDSPAQLRAKLCAGVEDVLGPADDALPLYLHLYHLEQAQGVVIEREAFQGRLLAAMRRVTAALAAQRPTVICLQDLHWADPSTVTLLADLVTGLNSPVLLLGNYRPGYTPPAGMLAIELHELSPRQTGELLASLLKGAPPAPLVGFMAERSDGNPFYVEELVNSLVETGVLVRMEQGWVLTRPLAEAGVPSTIRGVIAARIDRLDERRRRLLRHASVVGRKFMVSIISLVCEDDGDITPGLAQLQAADLIRQHRLEPELEYIFKHALTLEVAYDGLLKTERQVLHARTARAMEDVFADRIPEYVETLAYHYRRGGVADKAITYLALAGEKCVERYALIEAENHYREAYALLPGGALTATQCRTLAKLLIAWSQVHYYQGTIGQWHQLLEKHLRDAECCDDAAVLALYLGWLGNVRNFVGDMRGSIEVLDRALSLGQSVQAREAIAYVQAWRVFPLFELGRVAEAIRTAESLDQTEEERRNSPYPYVKCRGGLAIALELSGELRRARDVADELIAFGRASGSARAEAMGHYSLAMYWCLTFGYERAAASAQAGIDAAKDPLFRALNACALSLALLRTRRVANALDVCSEWLPFLESNSNYYFGQPMRLVRDASELAGGRLSDGLRNILAGMLDLQVRDMRTTAGIVQSALLNIHVAVVCKDVKPTLGVLMRNPWFVFTQAPFAAHKARGLIERLRVELQERNLSGLLGLVDLHEGRLLAHQGKKEQAQECFERIQRRLRDAGVDQVPAPVAELAAEIASRI